MPVDLLAGYPEPYHGLVRTGQAKLFAGQSLDGLGVGLEGIYLEANLAAGGFLLLDLLSNSTICWRITSFWCMSGK